MCEISYNFLCLGAGEAASLLGFVAKPLGLVELGGWFFIVPGAALIAAVAVGIKKVRASRSKPSVDPDLEKDCQRAGEPPSSGEEIETDDQEQKILTTSGDEERKPPGVLESMHRLVSELPEGTIKEYLGDLAKQIEADVTAGEAGRDFLLRLADSCGDIVLIAAGEGRAHKGVLGRFKSYIIELLDQHGANLLFSDTWNPDVQRAVSKEADPTVSSPEITLSVAYGLEWNDELIRKQEVKLKIPTT